MSDHDPLCPYSQPCPVEWRNDDWRRETGEVTPHRIVSGSSNRCVECDAGDCVCDIIGQAERRGYGIGYGSAMDDGWGEPGHIKVAVVAERERILDGVMNFYSVAPKAAEPMLRIIEGGWDGHSRLPD